MKGDDRVHFFYVWKFDKWKRWVVIVLLALFTALFLWIEQFSSFTIFTTKEEPTALVKGNPNESDIALTFNISWGEEKVYDILNELEKNQVQATFFVSGEWAERHLEILEKIVEQKHELGMMGYRYKSYLDQEIDQVQKDLYYAKEIFGKLGFDQMDLLRTPSGHFNKEVIDLAEQQGYNVIHWNVNPNDWENPGTQVITDHVMKETSNGDIILLHASDAAKQTANALKTILPGLKNKGFKFVTISELIHQTHSEFELVD